MSTEEISTKPYLLRALHDWCTDSGYTPHIVVEVDENTVVPPSHIQDGKITLNVGFLATNQLELGNEYISFQARFNGAVEEIFVPVAAVAAIFARETGAGMGFETSPSTAYTADESSPTSPATEGPTLVLETDDSPSADSSPSSPTDDDHPTDRSHLRIIK